ncbi:hypothetical protein [Salinarchaeum chitinilyticum]
MHRRRFVQLGIGAFVVAAAGFAVSGLSRLVVSTDTAILLGAPLLLGGFFLAVAAFVLAVLAKAGVVEIKDAAG